MSGGPYSKAPWEPPRGRLVKCGVMKRKRQEREMRVCTAPRVAVLHGDGKSANVSLDGCRWLRCPHLVEPGEHRTGFGCAKGCRLWSVVHPWEESVRARDARSYEKGKS